MLAAVGVDVLLLAPVNLVRDQGLRRGDVRLLAVMAYATPLGSALILGLVGMAALTPALLIGGLTVAGAESISR